jgi:hypothetical protein
VAVDSIPFSIEWLPDGRPLVVDGPRRRLLRAEPDGTLALCADLTGFEPAPFNEIVVADGHVHVNGEPGVVSVWRPTGPSPSWPTGYGPGQSGLSEERPRPVEAASRSSSRQIDPGKSGVSSSLPSAHRPARELRTRDPGPPAGKGRASAPRLLDNPRARCILPRYRVLVCVIDTQRGQGKGPDAGGGAPLMVVELMRVEGIEIDEQPTGSGSVAILLAWGSPPSTTRRTPDAVGLLTNR